MYVAIPDALRAVLLDKSYGHVVTRNPDGSPQVTMVWMDVEGNQALYNTADGRVKVAKLDFYPNINISATAGLQSLGLSKLFEGGSSTANFGPAISLPLFDGGRLAGRYRAAGAAYE